MQPDLHICIVSYNTRDLLDNCLLSIYRQPSDASLGVTVIDNGSSDGSMAMVAERHPMVRRLESGGNIGYGRANNAALLHTPGRYYAILNSDLILQRGALDRMVEFLDSRPEVGAAGGALLNPKASAQNPAWDRWESDGPQTNWAVGELTVRAVAWEQLFLARLFPSSPIFGDYFRASWKRDFDTVVPQACGAFLVVRAELFNRLGGFDPLIFMYCEDTDLCRRVRDAGYLVAFVSGAKAIHVHGQSSKGALRPRMIFEHNKSRCYYFAKHDGCAAAESARWLMIVGAKLRIIARWVAAPTAGSHDGKSQSGASAYLWVLAKTLCMRIPKRRPAVMSADTCARPDARPQDAPEAARSGEAAPADDLSTNARTADAPGERDRLATNASPNSHGVNGETTQCE